jgi:hypothetical protein
MSILSNITAFLEVQIELHHLIHDPAIKIVSANYYLRGYDVV